MVESSSAMLLSLIVFLPALGALAIAFFPREKTEAMKSFALLVTAVRTVSREARTGRGRSVMSRAMIACAVVPVCGGSPVNISYATAASE